VCAAVMICAIMLNIQTYRQNFDQLIWKAQPGWTS